MVATLRKLVGVVAIVALAVLGGQPAAASDRAANETLRIELPNGIYATVYSSRYLAARTSFDGTRGRIDVDGRFSLDVITDISDPMIANKGDGEFHPFPIEFVIEQLEEIDYDDMQVGVEVFVLPFPRANLMTSSTQGQQVFLSPHVYEPTAESVAYVVGHEMGHVFQERYMPVTAQSKWDEYRRLRGIDDMSIFNAMAVHANRPVEIFAEDFRVLYGGRLARLDGRIENAQLPPPSMVPGLSGFFATLSRENLPVSHIVSVNSYPNPFNPTTELQVTVSEGFYNSGDPVTIRIYDVRGAVVRELYAGAPSGVDFRVRWDGRDARGRYVASATYFGVIRAGEQSISRKLSLLK